ncbi:MAG: winged helix-turn-helix domain-containing protein [Cyanobacteria bacterium P01_E01_bin.35]
MKITGTKTIARMLKRFYQWLSNRRHFLFSWYTKDSQETQEPERSLVELPSDLRNQLVEAVENLPNNPADQNIILSKLDELFESWRNDPKNSSNSIVILSSPITAVSKILADTLEEWTKQKDVSLKLLPLDARPLAINSIKSKLEYHLAQESRENQVGSQLEIVLIPNLSWCFLRSLEGLEGIEYLQSLLCEDTEGRFWIIGGGKVGWEYLNSVCALEAYCGEVITLPKISPEDAQEWFEPVVTQLNIAFEEPRLDKQLLDGDKDNQNSYFKLLTDLAQGVSTIMVQVFLKSICYQETDESAQSEVKTLIAKTPKLTKLPSLESDDRYLLYSLLLHGDMTIQELAESLGDARAEIQARVEMLRRKGVVEQKEQILKINPIYYPQLKRELASNNFIINRE